MPSGQVRKKKKYRRVYKVGGTLRTKGMPFKIIKKKFGDKPAKLMDDFYKKHKVLKVKWTE